MSYLLCRRCGLQIRNQPTLVRVENCPRCMARGTPASPLVESDTWTSPAARWAATTLDRPHDRARRHT